MRFFSILILLFLSASLAFADSADLTIKNRKDGGKVIIQPKDAGGTVQVLAEYDPVAGTVTIPAGKVLKTEKIEGLSGGQPEGGVPSGSLIPYAGGTVPDGWLACDGSAVSRTTYANLFAAIGETWGAGDGSTTFNVPDLETDNRFLRSDGGSLSVGDTQTDSTAVNTLTITGSVSTHDFGSGSFSGTVNKNQWNSNQIPHYHTLSTGYQDSSPWTRAMRAETAGGQGAATNTASVAWNSANATTYISKSNFDHSHSDTFDLDDGVATETRPNAAVVKYIIKI